MSEEIGARGHLHKKWGLQNQSLTFFWTIIIRIVTAFGPRAPRKKRAQEFVRNIESWYMGLSYAIPEHETSK